MDTGRPARTLCSAASRYGLWVLANFAMLAGCTSQPISNSMIAMDYDQPGHPNFTADQAARIRYVLARVKPCQRALVRYAFGGIDSLVLFFAVTPGRGLGTKVLGTGEIYVPSDGTELPMNDNYTEQMQKEGIQFDIDHEPCAPPAASSFTVFGTGSTPSGEIEVDVLPNTTIYNVAIGCLGFVGSPANVASLPRAEASPEPALTGGSSYTKPLGSCPVLDSSHRIVDAAAYTQVYRRHHADGPFIPSYLVMVAYSPATGATEQYATFELALDGIDNDVGTWGARSPPTLLRDCCESALRVSLQR
jgi:hypothetical protein